MRLILVNGPPAIGKSTLAQRFVDDHPLALNLDIDAIRCSLGRWEEHEESKLLARNLGKDLARAHLASGHDVIVPQLLVRTDFIDELADLARAATAEFIEVMVLGPTPVVVSRFLARRAELTAKGVAHPEMAVERGREAELLARTCEQLAAMAQERSSAHVVHMDDGEIDLTYAALQRAVRQA